MSNRTEIEISRFLEFKKWQPPPFWIFKFLTVGHVKKVELRHRTKFRRNRRNGMKRGRDMVIFRFQDGGRRHFGFLKFLIFNGRTRH